MNCRIDTRTMDTEGCGCPCSARGCDNPMPIKDRETLAMQIAQCEFICIDINLYLDTHPFDERALSDYNCYAQQLRALKDMYIQNYGPIQNFGNSVSEGEWKWVCQTWPWNKEKGMEG